MMVAEEGMPVHGRPFIKGNLYIRFEVREGGFVVAGAVAVSCWAAGGVFCVGGVLHSSSSISLLARGL